jgi:hypothetical protein
MESSSTIRITSRSSSIPRNDEGSHARASRLLWVCFILFAAVVALAQTAKPYDGSWWASVSKSEQLGFVSGYVDCNDTELHGVDFLGSFIGFRKKVSDYYEQNPSARDTAVGDVLVRVAAASAKPAEKAEKSGKNEGPPGTAEISPQPGFFNGEYWIQAGPEQQLGYIEGYLWCHRHRPSHRRGQFSKSPADYREMVTDWYSDEFPGHSTDTPISEVLYRVRRQSSKPPKP